MSTLRLILKIPSHCQTGPDSWQDTTRIKTFDMPLPPELQPLLVLKKGEWRAVVVGAEVIE